VQNSDHRGIGCANADSDRREHREAENNWDVERNQVSTNLINGLSDAAYANFVYLNSEAPSGAKALIFGALCGTAEAVPFPKTALEANRESRCFKIGTLNRQSFNLPGLTLRIIDH
jgi:hypothetical protein